jgi:hypothetical protein
MTVSKKGIKLNDVQEQFEQLLNANCPASEKTGTGRGSCGGAVAGEKKEAVPKAREKTLEAKTLDSATSLINRMGDKFKTLDDKYKETKKGMKNPESPRNKKQLRDIEKARDSVGKQMDQIQKVIDKSGTKVKGQDAIVRALNKEGHSLKEARDVQNTRKSDVFGEPVNEKPIAGKFGKEEKLEANDF